jgi:exodeoxyribonuclease-1
VVRCTHALRPGGIQWPLGDDGLPSFKLERLAAANGLAHEHAHDALSDVRATIALARLIRARQPRLFDFCLSLRDKHRVARELGLPASLREVRPFLHISGQFGAARGCLAVMAPLTMHPVNKNELLAWDLSADPSELAELKPDAARTRLFTPAADLPEGLARLPVKSIHLNKSPIVISSLKTLDTAQAARWQIELGLAESHLQRLRALPDLSALWAEVFQRPSSAAPTDVDEDLYGGFIGNADRRRLEQLKRLNPRELALSPTGFDDPRLPELVLRYRARNFPDTLSDADAARWQAHRRARLIEGAHRALTLPAYFDRIDQLAETAQDDRSQAILGALYDWAENMTLE